MNTQKIIFDNVDDFPMIIFSTNFEIDSKSNRLLSSIYFNNLTLQGLFKTKEFSEHDKLEKACRFISFSNAGVEDLFFLIFFGVNNTKYIENFLKKLKKKKKLTVLLDDSGLENNYLSKELSIKFTNFDAILLPHKNWNDNNTIQIA